MDNLTCTQGDSLNINVVLKDSAGAVITSYDGTQPLATTIGAGGTAAASFSAATTWTAPATGSIAIAISGAQSALLAPGVYEGATTLVDGTASVNAYNFLLTVLPAPGGTPAPAATIVSVAEALASVPGLSSASTIDQSALVAAATSLIQAHCARVFTLGSYDEVHAPELSRSIYLRHYPVVAVDRVCSGVATGITITNATLVRPTVALVPSTAASDPDATATGLTLAGYSAGVPVAPITLTFAAYPTLGALAAAVNALGSGWSATPGSTAYADLPSTDLNPEWGTRSAASSGAPLRIYARDLQRYDVTPATGLVEIHEPHYAGFRYPDRTWGASGGQGSVRVRYTAGYAPTTMPDALKRAAFVLIQAMLQRTAVGMKLSEKTTLVSMQYGYAGQDMISLVADLVEPFRRRRLA